MKSGQATMKDDDCLFLKRDGKLEETYFSWSIVPLVGEDGSGTYATYPEASASNFSSLYTINAILLTFMFKLLAFTILHSTKHVAELRREGC